MKVELLRDSERPAGWWLLVGGSEQSFVDLDDPCHLEFEYVQMISYVVDTRFPDDGPLRVLHLGGGLCTMPRWLAESRPGSTQRVAEVDAGIAEMSASLGPVPGTDVVVADAAEVLRATEPASLHLLITDVYSGPETVLSLFPLGALAIARTALRSDGLYVCNLSDAAPFDLAKVVAATLRELFDTVVLLAEPGVLRGRRSGNVVLAATDRPLDLATLLRRAASGSLRARVMASDDLASFIGAAQSAPDEAALPRSGERCR